MKTYILIVSFSIGFCGITYSQNSEITERKLKVEKKYSDEIYAVHPVFDFANIHVVDKEIPQLQADSLIGSPNYTPDLPIQVRPLAYEVNSIVQGHRAMIKADKGIINPWYVQAGYVFSKPNHLNVNANILYDKWQSVDISDQHMRHISGNLGMDYYLTHVVKTRISFDYSDSAFGLYGFQNAESEARGFQVNYNNYGINLGASTMHASAVKWNADFNMHLNQWKDNRTDKNETNLTLRTVFDWNPSDVFKLSLAPTLSLSQSDYYLNGRIWKNNLIGTIDNSKWTVQLGLSAAQAQTKWSLWPKIYGYIQFSQNDKLEFTADQDLSFWGSQELTGFNPYTSLNSLQDLNETNVSDNKLIQINKHFSLEYTNSLVDKMEISIRSTFRRNNNSYNYKVGGTYDLLNISAVDYDHLTVEAEGSYKMVKDQVMAGLSIGYHNYINATDILYHRPNWTVKPSLTSHLMSDKLAITISAEMNDPQLVQTAEAIDIASSWRTNIGLQGRYRLHDQLSVYANVDNLLDDDYQVWSGYNNFGRNVSGGLLFKF